MVLSDFSFVCRVWVIIRASGLSLESKGKILCVWLLERAFACALECCKILRVDVFLSNNG
jgi:hypothetical protein